jgi:3-hydroxyacyl-[acyl-carrier-protein] dehydratase
MNTDAKLDSSAIMRVLAHRYPFLLVDRITIFEPGRRVEGIKQVTGAEWFGESESVQVVMPNMLAIEALAQTSSALLLGLVEPSSAVVGYFAAIERVRMRDPARAGDTLRLSVELTNFRRGVAHRAGCATVAGRRVVSANFTTIVRPAT